MINGKKVLAIIPARGGSKGIPKKNIKNVAGKPLIAWTIQEAQLSKYIDKAIVSSDDEEIIQVAKDWGCEVPFVRPKELAKDETSGIAPVLHAIDECPDFEYIVLLQPTSPLRTVEDIDGCIELFGNSSTDSCVSVCETDKIPAWMYYVNENCSMSPVLQSTEEVTRRQDFSKTFALNGAIYVASSNVLKGKKSFLTDSTIAYVMPKDRSVDIDTNFDLEIAEFLLIKSLKNQK